MYFTALILRKYENYIQLNSQIPDDLSSHLLTEHSKMFIKTKNNYTIQKKEYTPLTLKLSFCLN